MKCVLLLTYGWSIDFFSVVFFFGHRPRPFWTVKFNPWARQYKRTPKIEHSFVAHRTSLPLSVTIPTTLPSRSNLNKKMVELICSICHIWVRSKEHRKKIIQCRLSLTYFRMIWTRWDRRRLEKWRPWNRRKLNTFDIFWKSLSI